MILELKRQGLGVSAIARQTGLDRKTVRKYLERGLEAPVYGPRELGERLAARFGSYLTERLDTIARVRRAFYVQRWSMKKIVRELHVSRNTVRTILRSDETDFSYERTHQPMPRIGPWQDHLDRLLAANAGKPSRARLTLIQIFEELRALGYEGGYHRSVSAGRLNSTGMLEKPPICSRPFSGL